MSVFKKLFKSKPPPSPESVSLNEAFNKFRSNIPLQRSTVGLKKPRTWKFYEIGDENKAPLIMVPPLGGSAEVFFQLFNELADKGIRIISVQTPAVNDHDEWIESFALFLDRLKVRRVHLLGAGLGGFLCLLFTRIHTKRVISTIVVNSYATNIALQASVAKYEFTPAFVLRSSISRDYEKGNGISAANTASIEFFCKQMESLTQEELYTGLALTSSEAYIDKRKVDSKTLTIIETDDYSSLNPKVRNTCSSFFPSATNVTLRKGGDFPFISVADEIALYINVHMRRLDPSLLPNITTEGEGSTFSIDKDGKRYGSSVAAAPPTAGDDEESSSSSDSSDSSEDEKKKKKPAAKKAKEESESESESDSSEPKPKKKAKKEESESESESDSESDKKPAPKKKSKDEDESSEDEDDDEKPAKKEDKGLFDD